MDLLSQVGLFAPLVLAGVLVGVALLGSTLKAHTRHLIESYVLYPLWLIGALALLTMGILSRRPDAIVMGVIALAICVNRLWTRYRSQTPTDDRPRGTEPTA